MRRGGKRRVPRRMAMQLDFMGDRLPTAVVVPREPGGAAAPRHLARTDEGEGEGEQGLRPRAEPGEHLKVALMAAVPLWIMEMRRVSEHERHATAHRLSQIVAERSDILMFGGGKKGDVKEVFNAVARGLAALSFQPGGVKFCGLHWETRDAA